MRRPLVFGEVLFDTFPDGQKVLGGAPFNLCWHLQNFGETPLLISRTGRDPDADTLRQRMRSIGLDTSGVQTDPQRPTGSVKVELHDGQPSFEISPDQAYDQIDADAVISQLPPTAGSVLYRGTLATRSPRNRAALHQIQQHFDAPIFIDVNLRPPWWDADHVIEGLRQARWAKLNDTELSLLSGCGLEPQALHEAAIAARADWELELLILTQGAHGALWVEADAAISAPTPKVDKLVDTVGAGDAFSAISLLGLIRGWPGEVSLHRALSFAAEVCRQRGATINDPSVYQRTLTQWDNDV